MISNSVFKTERLYVAVFIHATDRLKFLGCEAVSNGRVTYIFADPEGRGELMELQFDQGAMVPASALFASQKYLRTQTTKCLNNSPSTGVYADVHRRH